MSASKPEDKREPWEKLSLQDLEKEYSPSRWSKRQSPEKVIPVHVKTVTESSKASKDAVFNRLDVTYGSNPDMKLDVFGEDLPKESCVLVYVHGGFWQDIHKDISAHVVQPLYRSGIVTVVVGYDLAPQVTVENIVSEVKEAVIWACDLADRRGSKGVVLSGHSAGGHLITHALSTAAEGDALIKHQNMIKGTVPLSGVFDLRPLVKTTVNEPLKLTESSSWALSPIAKISDLARMWSGVKLLVAVGEYDSPEFQRQSKEYCQRCVEAGLEAEYLEVEAVDHFNIVEDLSKNEFSLTQRIIEFTKKCAVHK